jgi:hypothetical protein
MNPRFSGAMTSSVESGKDLEFINSVWDELRDGLKNELESHFGFSRMPTPAGRVPENEL